MRIKELITRLLNKQVSYGTYATITLPWTAPKDGFLRVYLSPANTNTAYLLISGNNGEGTLRVNSSYGMAEYSIFPVNKGATYTYNTGGNIGTYALAFKPICANE